MQTHFLPHFIVNSWVLLYPNPEAWIGSFQANQMTFLCPVSSSPSHTFTLPLGVQGVRVVPMPCGPDHKVLRASHLSPVLGMSMEDQPAHRCRPGPLHSSEFNLISWFESSLTKSSREERGRALPAWETRASRVLACSIPQTLRTRRKVVCPEHVIPKAQGHLIGREGALSQELPCTKRSPCPTV